MLEIDRLLDICATAVLQRGGDGRTDKSCDSRSLLACAERTRVLPLLGWIFLSRQLDVSDDVRIRAISAFDRQRSRNRQFRMLASEIFEVFDRRGISAVIRKGTQVCLEYPDIGCRYFNDLDMLVPCASLQAAREAFVEVGLDPLPISREERAFFLLGTVGAPPFYRQRRAGSEYPVDVARAFIPPILTLGSLENDFTQAAMRRACRDREGLPVLSPADSLLDLTINLYLASVSLYYVAHLKFRTLTLYLDVVLTAERLDVTDWRDFDRTVANLNIGGPVAFSFANCLELFPDASVADELAKRIEGVDVSNELQSVGQIDGIEPYRWSQCLRDRLVITKLPEGMPKHEWF